MDPEANLYDLRMISNRVLTEEPYPIHGRYDIETDSLRLAELFQALDQWITKGGHKPKEWLLSCDTTSRQVKTS